AADLRIRAQAVSRKRIRADHHARYCRQGRRGPGRRLLLLLFEGSDCARVLSGDAGEQPRCHPGGAVRRKETEGPHSRGTGKAFGAPGAQPQVLRRALPPRSRHTRSIVPVQCGDASHPRACYRTSARRARRRRRESPRRPETAAAVLALALPDGDDSLLALRPLAAPGAYAKTSGEEPGSPGKLAAHVGTAADEARTQNSAGAGGDVSGVRVFPSAIVSPLPAQSSLPPHPARRFGSCVSRLSGRIAVSM